MSVTMSYSSLNVMPDLKAKQPYSRKQIAPNAQFSMLYVASECIIFIRRSLMIFFVPDFVFFDVFSFSIKSMDSRDSTISIVWVHI